MTRRDASRIRLGLLSFLASGVLSAIGLPLRGPVVLPTEDPQLWAQTALIGTHDLAWAILLPNLTIQLFGFMALYAFVRDTREERLAFWGMVLSIAGNGLFLPFTGILAFIDPELARLYLDGFEQAANVSTAGIGGMLSGAMLAASGIILLIGSVLISILLWKSPKLPTWTAPLYLLHALGLTLAAPVSYTLERSGGFLLLMCTVAIAVAVWRQTGDVRLPIRE